MSLSVPSGRTLGLFAGLGAAAFLGYCIYFDSRRRSHPDFKKKLREKRRAAAKFGKGPKGVALPDFTDQGAIQSFFLQEVQLGEELLAQGDVEAGVEHLSLAVAVCGQPHSLLGVLQQTLPPQIYRLLLQNLDQAQDRVRSHISSNVPGLARAAMAGGGGPGPAPSAPAPTAPAPATEPAAPTAAAPSMNEEELE